MNLSIFGMFGWKTLFKPPKLAYTLDIYKSKIMNGHHFEKNEKLPFL